jgi:hypothetical protein
MRSQDNEKTDISEHKEAFNVRDAAYHESLPDEKLGRQIL